MTPFPRSEASRTTTEDYTRLVAVNMQTIVNCCRAAVPMLRGSGGGSIVTFASGAAFTVAPGGFLAAYGMARGAVAYYSRHLAAGVGPFGINVNCLAPGVIRTSRALAQTAVSGFIAGEEDLEAILMGRQGEPDIADAVKLLVGPLARFITGQLIAVDGGASLV